MADNNAAEPDVGDDALVFDLPRLQDLEHYIRTRGIESQGDAVPNLNVVEAQRRVEQETAYQNSVHRAVFGDEKGDDEARKKKRKVLSTFEGWVVTLQTSDDVVKDVPLAQLALSCDFVYSMLSFGRGPVAAAAADKELKLSLAQFESIPVHKFVSVVFGKMDVEDIPSDCIIECCKIAHYLQARSTLDDIVEIVMRSIDSVNCMSICQLADQLHLPSLFETSLSHMLSSLDNIQDNDLWHEFPKDLQNRVLTMRNAVQSSILARGQRSRVFFTSSEEFLAIFSDNLREQRERLREAQQRQAEIIRERERSGFLLRRDVLGGSVRDAAVKIARQERRIRTLEIFYEEQKLIFSNGEMKGIDDNGAGFFL